MSKLKRKWLRCWLCVSLLVAVISTIFLLLFEKYLKIVTCTQEVSQSELKSSAAYNFSEYLNRTYQDAKSDNVLSDSFRFLLISHMECELVRVTQDVNCDERSEEFLYVARLFALIYRESEECLQKQGDRKGIRSLACFCLKTLNKVKGIDLKKYAVCLELCSESLKKEMSRFGFVDER